MEPFFSQGYNSLLHPPGLLLKNNRMLPLFRTLLSGEAERKHCSWTLLELCRAAGPLHALISAYVVFPLLAAGPAALGSGQPSLPASVQQPKAPQPAPQPQPKQPPAPQQTPVAPSPVPSTQPQATPPHQQQLFLKQQLLQQQQQMMQAQQVSMAASPCVQRLC